MNRLTISIATLALVAAASACANPATIKVDGAAATLDAEFYINRNDFGIKYAGRTNDLIRDEVVIKLKVRAPRAEAKSD